jgi:DNA polymerase
MRQDWGALAEEVRRLREEGLDRIYLSDEVFLQLCEKKSPPAPTERVVTGDSQEELPIGVPASKKVARRYKKKDPSIPDPPSIEFPEGNKRERWEWLRTRVLGCEVCNAHVKAGKKVVFGVGSIDANIFFCGEAPGAEEEIQGVPFVGPAGQLLTRIIRAMGLERGDVYIGNIMNWRPEVPSASGNRPPTQQEMDFCLPYLRAQVAVVEPKVIVALGATAVNGLLGPDPNRRMRTVRGKWFEFERIPLLVTYHPSYLLRNVSTQTKRTVWEDMLQVMERVGMPISEKQRKFFRES